MFSVSLYILRFITTHLRFSFIENIICFTLLRLGVATALKFLSISSNILFILQSNTIDFFLRRFSFFLVLRHVILVCILNIMNVKWSVWILLFFCYFFPWCIWFPFFYQVIFFFFGLDLNCTLCFLGNIPDISLHILSLSELLWVYSARACFRVRWLYFGDSLSDSFVP